MLSLYIVLAWLQGICYGFVLISSAAGEANFFQVGESSLYQYHSLVTLNENDESAKNVGFFITADVIVESQWGSNDERILRLQVRAPQLHVKSRKIPSPDGFIQHSSKLQDFPLKPFFLVWQKGRVDKILLPQEEPLALANLKKGIASLFQFQVIDIETNETDSSGLCTTTYHSIDREKFEKIKTNCISSDFPFWKTSDVILETYVASKRRVTYELDSELSHIKTIYGKETHRLVISAKEDAGSIVEADQSLTHVRNEKTETIHGSTLEEALAKVSRGYTQESLQTEKEDNGEDKNLLSLLNELRNNLEDGQYGTTTSAKAFNRLVEAARRTKKDQIVKILGAKKNKKILLQIYDVLGYVQSEDSHEAVMKKLHFDKDDHQDPSERYLWSLSLCSNPNPEVVKDLLNRYRKVAELPPKVKETLLLTVASMTRRLRGRDHKLEKYVEETILNGLDYAKEEERFVFLRALKNLRSPSTIKLLLDVIKKGSLKEGVLAFKALKSFEPQHWSKEILQTARAAFLQLDRKYDTSSRTLAIDILLEADPDNFIIDFVFYLKSNDSSFEVKQYLFQRLQLLTEEDPDFRFKLWELISSDPLLNNYSGLAPTGLSTAFKRSFARNPSINGSLLTIQEMHGGIVKRGIVNVMIDKSGITKEMFSLGIFAGGLSGFVGGESEDEESTTGGMDLTILDTQIRPFVFFTGQGELMGHVWSGTGSERTPAFQALILLQDHFQFVRLSPGFVAEFNLKGALSFDLTGQIEISIWNRNAESLIEKSAGIVVNGLAVVDTSFVTAQVEFVVSIEPKLHLKSDIDFSGKMNLCMRVTQPDALLSHNIFKTERIPGSQHKLKLAKYKKSTIPGRTYALNKKNNEMCSAMFS